MQGSAGHGRESDQSAAVALLNRAVATLFREIRLALSSTVGCFEIAGWLIANGSTSCAALASPVISRCRMRRPDNARILRQTRSHPGSRSEGVPMADKSPKKSTSKTAASKSLKEKRADKKTKAASKPTG